MVYKTLRKNESIDPIKEPQVIMFREGPSETDQKIGNRMMKKNFLDHFPDLIIFEVLGLR